MSQPPEANVGIDLKPGLLRAFKGIWIFEWQNRMTLNKMWLAACFVFTVPILMVTTLNDGQTGAFLRWLTSFHLFLLLPIYCLTFFGPIIRDELQADTLGFIITRPVKRHTVFILKYICVMIWTQILAAMSGGLFLGIAYLKGINTFPPAAPYFFLSQALAILAYGALGGLFGLLSKKYMVLGVVYGFLVEWGIGSIPTNIHSLAVSHHLRTILANNEAIAVRFTWTAGSLSEAGLMVFAATVIFLFSAALVFNYREYHHAEEMQK